MIKFLQKGDCYLSLLTIFFLCVELIHVDSELGKKVLFIVNFLISKRETLGGDLLELESKGRGTQGGNSQKLTI